ncbi:MULTISPECIES: hypothetical protein [Streptomyces]|uniref:hypothetical protein n=1 Tax=Streptomyces TaxID=1883 RepID=UPI000CD5802A|nr:MULTISPECIES: hypothetical protein [Streptomyces]
MTMASPVSHQALDGVSFRLDGDPDLDLGGPATSAADLSLAGRLVEITSGEATLGEDVAEALGIDDFDSELSFLGGTLRTAVTQEYEARSQLAERPMLVVWQGERSSLVLRLYGVTLDDVVHLLRPLRITESLDGLSLTTPEDGGYGFTRPASVIKEIPGLGLVEMSRPTREDTAQLPPWDGAAVASGRLYRDTLSDGQTFFLLSGEELWATVVPLEGAAEQVAARLGGLRLSVSGAGARRGARS